MKYAIIAVSGTQIKVEENQIITINKQDFGTRKPVLLPKSCYLSITIK